MKPVSLAIAAAVAAFACASSGPPAETADRSAASGTSLAPGWVEDRATADVVHEASGFRFAPTRNGCARTPPHAFDAVGDNASVGYDCPANGVWLTLFSYPSSFGGTPDPREHFELVVSDVLATHAGAAVRRAVEMPLPLGARELPGFNAYVEWIDREQETGSFVVLIPDGARFVKVRTSFPLGSTNPPVQDAWQLTLAVLGALAPAR